MQFLSSHVRCCELKFDQTYYCVFMKGISDNVPLVKVVVPKNQSHSFITQGSPDTMVSHDFVLGFSGFRKESRKGEEE